LDRGCVNGDAPLLRSRRPQSAHSVIGYERRDHMRRTLLVVLLLTLLAWIPGARGIDGPFVGLDVGASVPGNKNYSALTSLGATINPFGGYMFNRFIGIQGTLQFAMQSPGDVHGFPHAQQTTTLFGATGGPRLQLPLTEQFDLYLTGEGGYFTGLSGRLTHSA